MGFADDFLIEDASHYLAAWGESVVYTPRAGVARTITAIVDRRPRARMNVAGEVFQPAMVLSFKNSATTGIEPHDSACSGGTVSVAIRHGDTATTLTIPAGNPTLGDSGMTEVTI